MVSTFILQMQLLYEATLFSVKDSFFAIMGKGPLITPGDLLLSPWQARNRSECWGEPE